MAYRGRYIPTYPKKYKGDPSNIIYRSLWERKFMVYCDRNEKILEWGSEEFFVPYRSPLDGKIHRYFPDFYVKVKTPIRTTIITAIPRMIIIFHIIFSTFQEFSYDSNFL